MKRVVALLLFGTTLVTGLNLGVPAFAHSRYRVVVEGKSIDGSKLYLKYGQLMGAAASLGAAMGAQVRWDDAGKRLDMTGLNRRAAFWLGSRTVFRDGTRLTAPVAPSLHDGRVYLPVWFTGNLFGYDVTWDGTTMTLDWPDGKRRDGGGGDTGAKPSHPLLGPAFRFPFPAGATYKPYDDNYGDSRVWTPEGEVTRRHEGVDILAPEGTPLVAVASGTVVRIGWNDYGGWRLQIRPDAAPDYRIYYAHMSGYAKGIGQGARVRAGQLVGYVGSTGYGDEGTRGLFDPHLHLGIYLPDGKTINPYPFLKAWESRK